MCKINGHWNLTSLLNHKSQDKKNQRHNQAVFQANQKIEEVKQHNEYAKKAEEFQTTAKVKTPITPSTINPINPSTQYKIGLNLGG